MGKKIPTKTSMERTRKKKNYRLRKSVRRTLGALFLISAIIVATIPFPDAAAANPGTGGVPATNTLTYGPLNGNGNLKEDTEINQGIDLTKQGDKEFYTLRQIDGGVWRYEKQFDYYTLTSPSGAVLSKYNDLYSVTNLTLPGTISSGEYVNVDKTK